MVFSGIIRKLKLMKGLSNQYTCTNCSHKCLNGILLPDDLLLIERNMSEMHFSSDESIIKQGSFVSQVCFLKKGIVKIVLEGKNLRNTIVNIAEHGNFLAFPVLGNLDQYPFSLIALTDCEVCFIKKEVMYTLVQENRKVNAFVLDWYATDYNYMYSKMAMISTRNSHGKLASALLYLSNGNFKTNILKAISRRDLAELASTSKESTKKILQQLNHDGLIEISRDEIIIKRRDLLEHLSTVG